jgi:hypothetical protein
LGQAKEEAGEQSDEERESEAFARLSVPEDSSGKERAVFAIMEQIRGRPSDPHPSPFSGLIFDAATIAGARKFE